MQNKTVSSLLVFLYFFTLICDQIYIEMGSFRLKLSHMVGGLVFSIFIIYYKKISLNSRLSLYAFFILISILISSLFSVYSLKSTTYSLVWIFTFLVYFIFPINLMQLLNANKLIRIYTYSYYILGFYALLQVVCSIGGLALPFSVQTLIYVRGCAFAQEPSFYAMYAIPIVTFLNMKMLLTKGLIPNIRNNLQFGLRESCRQIDDRKWHSMNAIQCHLRSSIFGALTQPNCRLFLIFGINYKDKALLFCANIFLLASTTTTSILGYLVFLLLILFMKTNKENTLYLSNIKKNSVKLLCSITLILTPSYFLMSDFIKVSFFKFLFIGLDVDSFQVRFNGIINAFKVFCEYPLFGVGLGSTGPYLYGQTFFPKYSGQITDIDPIILELFDPTNTFTEVLSCLGLFGVGAFALFFLHIFKSIKRTLQHQLITPEEKITLLSLLTSLIVMIIIMQTNQGLFRSYIWVHLGLSIGYVLRVKKEADQRLCLLKPDKKLEEESMRPCINKNR